MHACTPVTAQYQHTTLTPFAIASTSLASCTLHLQMNEHSCCVHLHARTPRTLCSLEHFHAQCMHQSKTHAARRHHFVLLCAAVLGVLLIQVRVCVFSCSCLVVSCRNAPQLRVSWQHCNRFLVTIYSGARLCYVWLDRHFIHTTRNDRYCQSDVKCPFTFRFHSATNVAPHVCSSSNVSTNRNREPVLPLKKGGQKFSVCGGPHRCCWLIHYAINLNIKRIKHAHRRHAQQQRFEVLLEAKATSFSQTPSTCCGARKTY